jgi:DNA-binding response OmpR family regulator
VDTHILENIYGTKKNMNILITECDITSCNNLGKHLKERENGRITARDEKKSWECAGSNYFLCAMRDLLMPGAEGIDHSQKGRCKYQEDDLKKGWE